VKKIIFYKTDSGNSPVQEFIDSLSDKQAKKVAWVLRLVRDLETIPTKYFKKLINSNDIWEVRVQMGRNIFRFLGFYDGPQLIILSNGFQKKSQKTPKREIELAENRKQRYLKRRQRDG
jgi:phage-related protein